MHYRILNPTKYFSPTDLLGGEPTYKIVSVALEGIEEEPPKGSPPGTKPTVKMKGSARLEGTEKSWLINVTNAKALATMFGDDTAKWVGHCVTFCSEMVMSFGERVPGIRVRGSPEISGPMSYTVKRRKKSDTFNLVKTGGAKPGAPDLTAHYRAAMEAISKHLADPKQAGAFLLKVTNKTKRGAIDANDVALVASALAAEFDKQPTGAAPESEEDVPI